MDNLIIMGGNIISGAELVLLDYLKKSKDNFIIFTTKEIAKSGCFDLKNIEIIECDSLKMVGAQKSIFGKLKKILNIIKATLELKKITKKYRVKKILTNNTGDILYLTFFHKKEIKIYSYIHDTLEKNELISKLVEKNDKKIDMFIAVSDSTKKALENLGISSKKIERIYNGMESKEYIEKKEFSKKIAFVGAVSERKNPLEFLKFLEILKKHGYSGKIIYKYAEEDLLEKLKIYIKEKGLDVEFYHNLTREKIEDIYKNVDYLFVPSKKDPLPTVVLEAMNSSIPVIGNNIDGIPEMINNDYNGMLYKDFDEFENISMKVNNMSLDKYRQLSLNANKTIKEKFDNNQKVLKLDNMFSENGGS